MKFLLAVERKREGGIFHCSGEVELSYSALAQELATRLGVSASLVSEVNATERGIVPVFRPVHPALGMGSTRARLGIEPQPLVEAIAGLLLEIV